MIIAIDESPLVEKNFLQHKVRGTGFYVENLKKSLLEYCPSHTYIFFNKSQKMPQNADIVHYPYFDPFFLTLPFPKKVRRVVTVHDLTPLVFPKAFPVGLKGAIKWQIQRYILRRSDAIITDSFSSKNDIVRLTGINDEKIKVIYLSAGQNFSSTKISRAKTETLRKKFNLPNKFVLYVGDVTWNKNLPRLLQAVKKIGVPLVMVGKALTSETFDLTNAWNQDLQRVKRLAQDNSNIILLGFVPTQDLSNLYKVATVFAMPSLYEGFGLPILEAMKSGCPVVTTTEGSIKEIAGKAAWMVNPYKTEDIAAGIAKVYNDISLQESLRIEGFMQANKFSWEKTAKETMEVYEKKI